MESCEKYCGSKENPTKAPLPKCKEDCYTTSEEENAYESCEDVCYNKNNESCEVGCIGSEPLPKCKHGCYTTSKEKNALEACEEMCGDDENLVNG